MSGDGCNLWDSVMMNKKNYFSDRHEDRGNKDYRKKFCNKHFELGKRPYRWIQISKEVTKKY